MVTLTCPRTSFLSCPWSLLGNQEAISKMCLSHVTPQPKGLAILSARIQSKCPNTAATVYGDLWGHSYRPTSRPSLQTPIPFPARLFQILPSVGELLGHFTDKEKHGTEKPHLQPKVTQHQGQAWKHSSAPAGLKTDSITPSKTHREPSTEAMASEAREGTANWAEQCVARCAQLKQINAQEPHSSKASRRARGREWGVAGSQEAFLKEAAALSEVRRL